MPTIDSKHATRRAIHLEDSVAVACNPIKKEGGDNESLRPTVFLPSMTPQNSSEGRRLFCQRKKDF